MIAWWEAYSVVERSRQRAAATVNKMCELERACWERSEAYTQARADEAVECALRRAELASDHRVESVVESLLSRSRSWADSETLRARYPWREEVRAMSGALPDPSTLWNVQSLQTRGIL